MAFVATSDPAATQRFYEGVLGLRLIVDEPFALVFDAGGTTLRISKVEVVTPAPYTVLGWDVPDIQAAVRELAAAGVSFRRFEGLSQDEAGVWAAPAGAYVAWFNDPDGNMLSVSQQPA
jgi:catechol 2,3-dioxygenase-like lactoylglutathione lyase family enzyme